MYVCMYVGFYVSKILVYAYLVALIMITLSKCTYPQWYHMESNSSNWNIRSMPTQKKSCNFKILFLYFRVVNPKGVNYELNQCWTNHELKVKLVMNICYALKCNLSTWLNIKCWSLVFWDALKFARTKLLNWILIASSKLKVECTNVNTSGSTH